MENGHRETSQSDVHLSKGEMMVTCTEVPERSGGSRTACEDFKKQKGVRKRNHQEIPRSWLQELGK